MSIRGLIAISILQEFRSTRETPRSIPAAHIETPITYIDTITGNDGLPIKCEWKVHPSAAYGLGGPNQPPYCAVAIDGVMVALAPVDFSSRSRSRTDTPLVIQSSAGAPFR